MLASRLDHLLLIFWHEAHALRDSSLNPAPVAVCNFPHSAASRRLFACEFRWRPPLGAGRRVDTHAKLAQNDPSEDLCLLLRTKALCWGSRTRKLLRSITENHWNCQRKMERCRIQTLSRRIFWGFPPLEDKIRPSQNDCSVPRLGLFTYGSWGIQLNRCFLLFFFLTWRTPLARCNVSAFFWANGL